MEEFWNVDDLTRMNAVLDAFEDAEARAEEAARNNRGTP
jgi:hypothetical protein